MRDLGRRNGADWLPIAIIAIGGMLLMLILNANLPPEPDPADGIALCQSRVVEMLNVSSGAVDFPELTDEDLVEVPEQRRWRVESYVDVQGGDEAVRHAWRCDLVKVGGRAWGVQEVEVGEGGVASVFERSSRSSTS